MKFAKLLRTRSLKNILNDFFYQYLVNPFRYQTTGKTSFVFPNFLPVSNLIDLEMQKSRFLAIKSGRVENFRKYHIHYLAVSSH